MTDHQLPITTPVIAVIGGGGGGGSGRVLTGRGGAGGSQDFGAIGANGGGGQGGAHLFNFSLDAQAIANDNRQSRVIMHGNLGAEPRRELMDFIQGATHQRDWPAATFRDGTMGIGLYPAGTVLARLDPRWAGKAPTERFLNDPVYNRLVGALRGVLNDQQLTPDELLQAANLACLMYKESHEEVPGGPQGQDRR